MFHVPAKQKEQLWQDCQRKTVTSLISRFWLASSMSLSSTIKSLDLTWSRKAPAEAANNFII
jgi:hypothetical protein